MTKNFILTDVMGSDNSDLIIKYVKLSDEPIDTTDSFYKLHNFDLKKYSRLFAIIDHRMENHVIWKNKDYWQDFSYRLNFLKQNNFVFIIGQPWESKENMAHLRLYEKYLQYDARYLTWDGGADWFWFYMQTRHKNFNLSVDHSKKKVKDFLYLNKRARPHRLLLFNELKKKDLLHNSIFSFIDKPHKINLEEKYELPWVKNYPSYGRDHEIYSVPYNDSAVSIVSETNISNENIFLTEKIWKPIIAKHIFIIHGAPHYLEKLKSIGFKTFEKIFDESYDSETDQIKKIMKIVQLCKEIKKLDYKKLYEVTAEIRNHNYKIFFDQTVLKKHVNLNVLNFFKFFDRS